VSTLRRCAVFALLASALSMLTPAPASAAPTIVSFTVARVAGTLNDVQLTWDTSDATEVHIFGASGDPGTLMPSKRATVDGTVTVKSSWGTRSFRLGAKDATGAWKYSTKSVNVPPPPSISITSTNPETIDYFRSPNIDSPLPPHNITWDLNGADRVKMRVCVSIQCGTLPDVVAPNASFTVTEAHLTNPSVIPLGGGQSRSILGPAGQGFFRYELTPCEDVPGGGSFCGPMVQAHVRVLPSQITLAPRQYRNFPMWLGLTLNWSANGASKVFIDAPTLGVNNVEVDASLGTYTIPAARPAGLHTITLKSCKEYPDDKETCAFRETVRAPAAGTVDWLLEPGEAWGFVGVASVNGQWVYPSRHGTVESNCGCLGQHVEAGDVLAVVETPDVSHIQLQVGGKGLRTIPWTTDFDPARSSVIPYKHLQGSGAGGNGTTLDAAGNIYSVGELTGSMVRVEGTTPSLLTIPLLHKPDGNGNLRPVSPFRWQSAQVGISNSQDMFEAPDGKLWFTQGWGFQNGTPLYNHNRVFRFDPTGEDLDTTLQDDRFCAYNVPGDHNGVIGVTTGGGRTWFVEQRVGVGPSVLTHFNPSDSAFQNCTAQNNLDYSVAHPPGPAFSPGYCNPDPTVQTGCFEPVTLPPQLEGAGHIAYDQAENALWIADYSFANTDMYEFGVHYLGRYDIAAKSFTLYPLPKSPHQNSVGAGTPWKVLVHGNYVYVTELDDGDIVRFDKAAGARQQGLCDDRDNPVARALTAANGWQNPCMSEVHLPVNQGAWQTRVMGNRLYFTAPADLTTRGLANDPSVFGYVDLANWDQVTQYTGLDTFSGASPATGKTTNLGWFDADPATGTVAIGAAGGDTSLQFLKLVPN
jgi:hypothetical protein